MTRNLIALISGLLFGIGLLISGMTNPAKIRGFLDVTGAWDPSLACVMAGALMVGMLAFMWAKRQQKSVLGESMNLQNKNDISLVLILGSVVFGIGWGLSGYCPGPAVVSLLIGGLPTLTYVLGMLLGILIFKAIW